MKKVVLLTVLFGLFLVSMVSAQEPGDTLWTRTYGGSIESEEKEMESTKDRWLNYFLSIRNSRREDMRHYMALWIATFIALTLYLLDVCKRLFSNRGLLDVYKELLSGHAQGNGVLTLIVAAIIASIVLGVAFAYFFKEYKLAEKEIKYFSDAIELILLNEPQTNSEYRKLYYMSLLGKHEIRTDWGFYISKQNYLYNIFFQKRRKDKFFEKYEDEVPNLHQCYSKPDSVMKSLIEAFPNH